MTDPSIQFSREELKAIIADVRKTVSGSDIQQAWVWTGDRRTWEFHFRKFYWSGRADNAYDARSKGWTAYLRENEVAGYRMEAQA